MKYMRKSKALLLLLLAGIKTVTGCSHGKVKMSYYDECKYEDNAEYSNINENLFYRNELVLNKTVRGADPAVMQITDRNDPDYGKFILLVTTGSYSFSAWMSSDLAN